MKKILIPTDFSSHSRYTVRYIIKFLQDTQIPCHIHLLNTYIVLNNNENDVIAHNDEMKKNSQQKLLLEVTEAKKLLINPSVTIESISRMGSLKNVINQLIQREKFDFVAMGKDGGKHVEAIAELLKEKETPLFITYLSA